tara:strand:- start:3655 stop:4332 length:678 start_codon:yes stop_codon:yes gene_type:complete
MERIFDIVFSILALTIISPFLLIIIFILKLTGENKIFYLQERIGKDRKIFKIYKFATMLENSPNLETGSITIKNDPRILPFGRFLRKTKINELPQLLNILSGEMSIIGPRPLTSETFKMYSKNTQDLITGVRPGLSGIGSIIFRAEENILQDKEISKDFYIKVISPYKGLLEEWYINNNKIYLYFLFIFLTIWLIFFPNSKITWRVLKNLPKPPDVLRESLNFLG